MNNKLLVVYESKDKYVFEELENYFSKLLSPFNTILSPYQIKYDGNQSAKSEVDEQELVQFTRAVEDSSIVVILVSNPIRSSLELDAFFQKHHRELKSRFFKLITTRNPFEDRNLPLWALHDCCFVVGKFKNESADVLNPKAIRERFYGMLYEEIREPLGALANKTDFRVFISYSSKDGYFADLLKYKLKENKIKVAMDQDFVQLGEDWKEAIDDEIEGCSLVLLVYSKNAKISEYVTYEWAYAMARGKTIFTILVNDESQGDKQELKLHPKLSRDQVYRKLKSRENANWDELVEIIKDRSIPKDAWKKMRKREAM